MQTLPELSAVEAATALQQLAGDLRSAEAHLQLMHRRGMMKHPHLVEILDEVRALMSAIEDFQERAGNLACRLSGEDPADDSSTCHAVFFRSDEQERARYFDKVRVHHSGEAGK